ncbi:cation diffusion facilitator family transporter [Solimonas aquatica]|uniref:Cation diffusion facilitator family transporter n=1 Tax=Solimonas aquatica TaxID=489703 RepID=A0A1H9IKK3_9GAMM|nr:cation diffusion facilitator family transporter [Solimonas aquatica]SEQ75012.1 cation diffusion facilitator family transporter [Solimonas aquatica]
MNALRDAGAPARYAWLSVAAAVTTLGLKLLAWSLTGSVAMLSDALESLVNLGASLVALMVLRWAAQPPDAEHAHGHGKAEYLSSGFEGALIFVAAGMIIVEAAPRLLHPRPIEQAGLGVAVSMAATLINLLVARVLFAVGKRHRSPALKADAHHLMSDVWTSAGILVSVVVVHFTGWQLLDPAIALLVALFVLWVGWKLLGDATDGLMDRAWSSAERKVLDGLLQQLREQAGGAADFHAVRTRTSGAQRFLTLHVLVPGAWSVQRGHDFVEQVEHAIVAQLGAMAIVSHLEPLEDPRAYDQHLLEKNPPAPEQS